MALPTIHEATILAFDNQLSLAPLLQAGHLRPPFTFLSQPDAYRAAQESEAPLTSERFEILPLRRDLKRNKLWKAYRHILPPGKTEAALCAHCWALQIPVRCVPREGRYTFVSRAACHLRAEMHLCPSGWSSSLELRLRGAFTVDELRQMRHDFAKESTIRVGGKNLNLSQVFSRLRSDLLLDLYGEEKRHDVDAMASLQRFLVIAILTAEGRLDAYDDAQMPAGDRARLQGLLRGREIGKQELWDLEHPPRFRLTWFRPSEKLDFALTDFEIGSLLSFTGSALHGKNSRSLGCAGTNAGACHRLVHHLVRFHERSARHAAGNPQIAELRAAAAAALRELPDRYKSAYCSGLYLRGDPAYPFRHPGKPGQPGDKPGSAVSDNA